MQLWLVFNKWPLNGSNHLEVAKKCEYWKVHFLEEGFHHETISQHKKGFASQCSDSSDSQNWILVMPMLWWCSSNAAQLRSIKLNKKWQGLVCNQYSSKYHRFFHFHFHFLFHFYFNFFTFTFLTFSIKFLSVLYENWLVFCATSLHYKLRGEIGKKKFFLIGWRLFIFGRILMKFFVLV